MRLHRALYGLKQAQRSWQRTYSTRLARRGLRPSPADPNVYLHEGADGRIISLVYVDDGMIVADSDADADATLALIMSEFPCRDLGSPVDFLGWELERDAAAGTIKIHQERYVVRLLQDYGLTGCAPVRLPMTALPSPEGEPLSAADRVRYPALIGSLLHLANCTRPDIAQPVSTLARFIKCPKAHHWTAALRVLRYLAGTPSLGITYGGQPDTSPFCSAMLTSPATACPAAAAPASWPCPTAAPCSGRASCSRLSRSPPCRRNTRHQTLPCARPCFSMHFSRR